MFVLKNVFHVKAYPEGSHKVEVKNKKENNTQKSAHGPVKGHAENDSSKVDSTKINLPEQTEPLAFDGNPKEESDDDRYFQELLNIYTEDVLSTLPEGKSRTNIVIRYYFHEGDNEKVYSLKKLGFYLHQRPVEKDLLTYESNSLYYGDNISIEDIQLIAYTLVTNGLPLKQIIPSKYHDSWKSNSIEIGTDTALTQQDVLTTQQIRNFLK
ncbi:MAG: hypothetical protein OEY56_09320 [Cyclobacteriaceae bacterium]|nr:hypothetical protein [Cyclobacteriaceae bacterium]